MEIANFCLLGTALLSCNPQVMCTVSAPVVSKFYQPGPLEPTDSQTHLQVGHPAPDFTLPSLSGKDVTLSELVKDHVVVISFVPSAWTPVCSEQWPGYNLAQPLFEEHNAVLVGITVDNLASLYAWTQDMGGVWFHVLSDFYPHGKVSEAYGILRGNGTSERALFVIDQSMTLRFIDVHDIHERPPLDELIAALDAIKP